MFLIKLRNMEKKMWRNKFLLYLLLFGCLKATATSISSYNFSSQFDVVGLFLQKSKSSVVNLEETTIKIECTPGIFYCPYQINIDYDKHFSAEIKVSSPITFKITYYNKNNEILYQTPYLTSHVQVIAIDTTQLGKSDDYQIFVTVAEAVQNKVIILFSKRRQYLAFATIRNNKIVSIRNWTEVKERNNATSSAPLSEAKTAKSSVPLTTTPSVNSSPVGSPISR